MALMRSFLQRGQALLQDSLIPLLARTGLAATFWLSGQSKVEGLDQLEDPGQISPLFLE